LKRDKYDSVISDLVRSRADFTCERCRLIDPDGQARGKSTVMDASHFNSRGAGNVCRYDTDLIFCLCKTCHSYVEGKPYEHTNFVLEKVGEKFMDLKAELHNRPRKMTKAEKEEMHQHYKSELKRIKEERASGIDGHIDVLSWF
jgi:hypothetical protein